MSGHRLKGGDFEVGTDETRQCFSHWPKIFMCLHFSVNIFYIFQKDFMPNVLFSYLKNTHIIFFRLSIKKMI